MVKRFDNGQIDTLYWSGVFFAFAIIGVIMVLILKIAQKTKEIKPFVMNLAAFALILIGILTVGVMFFGAFKLSEE
ncbi:MAG: hypothetical protein U9Q90_06840 [Campylobacterota bacterium]|nr:hypothetical protein [Campylobacterota bacterium]